MLKRHNSAWRGSSLLAASLTLGLLVATRAHAAGARTAVSTINHAFATELGTGFYDIGGRSVFIVSIAPGVQLRDASDSQTGLRLVVPMAAGSFDFVPNDAIEGRLPDRIDSFSIMPGLELQFRLRDDWMLAPWLRAGASFAGGASDGALFGVGARLSCDRMQDERQITQRVELGLVRVNYRNLPDDTYLRLRNAMDVRQPTLPLGASHRLLAGVYGILDIVPDAPATAPGVKPAAIQLEVGFTLNATPRPNIGRFQWPRLGIGYRFAGDFSGWRIVIGAPF